ncbi:MAG: tRNA guanosine(15) transglycosylase TgtA, partial [Halobacteriales archaeon]|nr:tRNA guanosine(15) transglycosylase TgtA [Halobacteriales archaeon]
RAAAQANGTDLDVFPIGAVVPLLEAYRFGDMVDIVMAAKRGLGADAPVHLFGAGHPMMLALAAAAGCDLFDSAAYALYARDGRYMTVRGTEHLADLEAFPCTCPVCSSHDPADLEAGPADERERLLAEHNLHVTFAEVRRVREAIRGGDLLELVEERARAHPAMLDGYRALLAHTAALERHDPAVKGTFFYLSSESADRPEVHRHHARLDRLDPPESVVLVADGDPEPDESSADAVRWPVLPPFGPVPPALRETYPLTAERPDRTDAQAYAAAVDGIRAFTQAHPDVTVTFAHDHWPATALVRLPETVTLVEATRSD